MTYDFSFDRKSVALLAGCGVVFAVLLVSAGYLLGLQHAEAEHAGEAQQHQIAVVQSPGAQAEPVASAALRTSQATPTQTEPAPVASGPESRPELASQAAQLNVPEGSVPISLKPGSPPSPKSKYCLQFGAFQDKANASAKLKSLKEEGIEAEVLVMHDSMGRSWFAVRTGSYSGLMAATNAARVMSDRTSEYVVVRRGLSL